ncbi:MAG: tyrosine-protein phosphatase [Acholeplasmataceae bacterium]
MIDIHTHILYGVDDGAKNIETSIQMLQALSIEGIKKVVCTPHVAPSRNFNHSKKHIEDRFDMLKNSCKEQGIDMDLFLGAEVDENDQLHDIISQGFTLNQSKYVLIDFGMRQSDICEIIYELNVLGYQTIVAHPERYKHLSLMQLTDIKKEGALFQVTANNLIRPKCRKTKKRAKWLLKTDMIDVIASDTHVVDHTQSMRKAYHLIARKKGEVTAKKLFIDNPNMILGLKE